MGYCMFLLKQFYSTKGPLSGIRVLDLSHTLSGPMATMILGDYGAEVIKVEKPGTGDETRSWGPPFVEKGQSRESAYFLCLNRNKRSITVNIKTPQGQELLHELCRKSDVFVANFPNGKLHKYRLDWNTLRGINEKLVYVNVSGYGPTGPYASRPAYDLIMEGETGVTDLITKTSKSKTPITAGIPISDIITALYTHGAVMAGLMQRNATGKGLLLETSLFTCQLSSLTNYASNSLLNTEFDIKNNLSNHPSLTPYQAFESKEGEFFNIAALNNPQFEKLCSVLGHMEWPTDARFKDNHDRTANRSLLINLMTKVTKTQSVDYWIEKLNQVRVPCGRINTIQEALHHPQIRPNRMIQTLEHSKFGKIDLIGPAVKVSDYEGEPKAPPILGQDTEAILKGLLGKTDEEINQLRENEAI